MRVKSPHAVSPRFPAPRSSAQGESAPKARPKGVVDGKLVNIPAPRVTAMGGRRRLGVPAVGCRGKAVGMWGRQIRLTLCRAPRRVLLDEVTDTTLPGKASKLQVTQDRTVNRHR